MENSLDIEQIETKIDECKVLLDKASARLSEMSEDSVIDKSEFDELISGIEKIVSDLENLVAFIQ